MLVYLQSFVAVAIGILSTVTDFKEKKIYNKTIICGVSISLLLYIVLWNQIDMELIKSYVINLGISVLISFLFFYFKIWAAGDAKLFIAMIIMTPFELYEVDTTNVFPGIYLLIIIFSVAFIYVVIETIFLWSKDSEKFKKIKITRFDAASVKEWLEKYFMGYFITLFVNNVIFTAFPAFQEQNGALILICNMLLLIFVYRVIQSQKQTVVAIAISAALNVIYYAIMGFTFYPINIKMLVIVVAIMLFRNVSEKYNYECIKITDLKPRMILSYGSVLKFYSSRIKGLPKQTTESTDSRLTEDEVNSIKRWSKSAKGEDSIVIVRHMPFAPFMLIGEIIFLLCTYIFRKEQVMINRPLALKGTNIIRNNDEYIIGKVIKNTNVEDDPSKYIQVLDDENIAKYQEGCKGYIFENKPKNIDLTDINYGYNIKNFETLINYDVIEMLGDGVIRVLYRDDSDDNAIVVTNQCNSNCIMCPDSNAVRNTKENPNIKKILEQIECIPDDTEHITITGGEVGILKGNFIKVLEKCKECLPNTEFLVLTNGRVFSVKEYTEKIAEVVPNNVRFAIPIYAGEPKLHDEITRVPGSFKQAIAGIHNLMNKNIDIEIRIVVLKKNYKELENIAKFIVKNMPQVKMVNIMALEMTGNAFKNKDQVWINFADVSDYLYKACMRLIANGIVTNLYNFPLCCIDERLYSISRKSITDYKVRYKEQCEECNAQDCCGGFFSSTINIKDITIKPIKS